MTKKNTLLGKTFGIYCPTHPDEFHNTILFEKIGDSTIIYLNASFTEDEWHNYSWKITTDSLIKFEKYLKATGIATIETEKNLLAIKLVNEKIFLKIQIVNKLPGSESKGFTSNHWREMQEK